MVNQPMRETENVFESGTELRVGGFKPPVSLDVVLTFTGTTLTLPLP
jgi:hypothetical protein